MSEKPYFLTNRPDGNSCRGFCSRMVAQRITAQEYPMEKLTNFQPEDVLTDVLRSVHMQGTLYCRSRMRAPWGFRVAGRDTASFHVVTAGQCWLDVEGTVKGVRVAAGDVIILPHGHAHLMRNPSSAPAAKIELLDDLIQKLTPDKQGVLRYGQGGVSTTLLCGGFRFEGDLTTNPLLSALPAFIHIKSKNSQLAPWVQATVKSVEAEAGSNQAGAETVIARLSEVLFIQAIRAFIRANNPGDIGWLKALHDPQIGMALALIHSQPQEPWTLASLSRHVGLSRTAFSMRFKELTGVPPLRYLARWRLHKAAAHLRSGRRKLTEIARLVGYDSEVTLSKAFKRQFGVAPGAYRHETIAAFDEW
jgi:AraC-like DNA-binding protein/mannose-6-phosphate isomerase-like protein (cupin superfamily)